MRVTPRRVGIRSTAMPTATRRACVVTAFVIACIAASLPHARAFESANVKEREDEKTSSSNKVELRSFFDARDLSAHALEQSSHNALHRIDGTRVNAVDGRVLATSGFEIQVNASSVASGERVTVTVSSNGNAPNATFAEHWIGVYSPAGADVTRTAPVKYAMLTNVTNGEYERTGSGSAAFDLTTHRAETYDFVLFATRMSDLSETSAMAIARSDPVKLTNALDPVWPRVTLPIGWNGGSARVTWQSGRNASHGARLMYRVGGGSYTRVPASTTTYDERDLCGEPANGFGYRHPGYIHSADVSNVRPGDVIEYFLQDFHVTSDRFEMKMPPGEGPDARVTLALFADMGRGTSDDSETWRAYGRPSINVSAALAADALDEKFDAVFLFGDLSYATGFASIWDDWAAQIEPWASKVPFISNMGNHEMDYSSFPDGRIADLYGGRDSGGECGVPATRLYPTPRAGPDSDWFAVTFGAVRVVSMNTEVDFSPSSPQGKWLERELSSVDRTQTPWVILGGHRPGIIDSTDGPDDRDVVPGKRNPSDLSVMDELQRDVWPLLVKYEVNAAFWGHNHAYQRSCAWRAIGEGLFNASNGCVAYSRLGSDGVAVYDKPGAPVSLLVGTGGAKHTRNGVGHAFTEKAFYEFGYVRLTAHNRTHLYGEYQEAGSGYGDVLDKFMIIQPVRVSTTGDDDEAVLSAKLERALSEVKTWRGAATIMAVFVCATFGIGAFAMARHWKTESTRHRFSILTSTMDDGAL